MQALAQWAVLRHALVLSQASTNSLHHASCADGLNRGQHTSVLRVYSCDSQDLEHQEQQPQKAF